MSETIPLKQAEATTSNDRPNHKKVGMMMTMMSTFGLGVAYACSGSSAVLDKKIDTIKSLDLQWFYLGLVVLGKTIMFINFAPMGYKNSLKGNMRSNPFFYEAVTPNGQKKVEAPLIAYKEDGPLGKYNRSNRSVQNMVEGAGGFFAALGPVGFLFPKATLGAISAFSIGRIVHQKLYARGYGPHALGFMFAMLSMQTIDGLALVAFLKAQGYIW